MKRLAIYANCQAAALGRTLHICEAFREGWEFVRLDPVHRVSQQTQQEVLEDIAPTVDVLVHQPIRDAYRGELFGARRIVAALRPGAESLSFPSLQFYGYQPASFLFSDIPMAARNAARERFGLVASELFHYEEIVRSYLAGLSVDEALERFADGDGTNDERSLNEMAAASIEHMRNAERELDIDVTASDLIAERYRDRMMFHTPRHPTSELLMVVADRIFDLIGLTPSAGERERMLRLEPLGSIKYPFQPYVGEALGLTFELPRGFAARHADMTDRELVESYYWLYDMFEERTWRSAPRVVDALPASR